jgi:hypothetical protein
MREPFPVLFNDAERAELDAERSHSDVVRVLVRRASRELKDGRIDDRQPEPLGAA